ncbi:ABC transporter ATP-binding protein [Amycolatopsis sp. NPDC051373]|uniref:ABC transporter ATP-binding protein n=1 Tax=Amycolatopsis sp. NPDC051373 TaxID=3155801 RepID=UPI00344CD432
MTAIIPAASDGGTYTSDADSPAKPASVRQAFRRFWPYVRAERRLLLLAILLLVISAVAETVAIWTFGVIIDDALTTGDLRGFWRPAAIWVGMAAVGGFASFGGGLLTSWVSERFLLRLRDAVYAHLQQLSPDFFARHDTGDLVARVTSDIEMVEQLTASGTVETVSAIVTAIFYAGAALIVSWHLALASFILAPLFGLAARSFSKRIKTVSRDERDYNGMITAAVQESLTNLPLVQAYNQQHTEQQRLHAHGASWMRTKVREARVSGAYAPLVDITEVTALLLVVGAGIWEISQHHLTPGGVLAFTAYVGYLYPPLRQLGSLTIMVNAATASSDRISELLNTRPTVVDHAGAHVLAHSRGEISVDRVSYRYPDADRSALTELSFTVRRGQLVVITGASGAGKSTITKLLLRFADPSSGSIRLDGFDLRGITTESLREQVTLVLQQTQVFHGTVRDNIAYGRPSATDSQIVAAAVAADAHEFISALPEGYQTALDGAGHRLSGGQRQRLAIARAIVRDTPILVLDEPTAGLDARAVQRVIEPLRRLASGKTTILISHDLSLAPASDHILMLDHGRLIESGRHQDLLDLGGPYAKLYAQHRAEAKTSPASPGALMGSQARPEASGPQTTGPSTIHGSVTAARREGERRPGTEPVRWRIQGQLFDPEDGHRSAISQ